MPDLKKVLEEYVATANNPKYNSDFNVINSKFPELKNYDKKLLEEYVATANNEEYNSDFNIINSKFPEFFGKPVEKKNPNVPTASSGMGVLLAGKGKAQSGLEELNKEVVKGVVMANINERKELKKREEQAKITDIQFDILAPNTKVLPNFIRSGITSIASGLSYLPGALLDIATSNPVSTTGLAPGSAGSIESPKLTAKDRPKEIDNAVKYFYNLGNDFKGMSEDLMLSSKLKAGIKNPNMDTISQFSNGNFSDGIKSLALETGQTLTQTAAMIAGGAPVIGASMVGSNLGEEINQDGKIDIIDLSQSVGKSIGELYLEKFFNKDLLGTEAIIKGLGNLLTPAGQALKKEVLEKGASVVKSEIIRDLKDVGKKVLEGQKDEILEETAAVGLSFFVDAIDQDKFNVESFKQLGSDMANSALIAATSGGLTSGLAARVSMQKLSRDEKTSIDRLQSVANDETKSQRVRDIALSEINNIRTGAGITASETMGKVSKLPLEKKMEALAIKEELDSVDDDLEGANDLIREKLEPIKADLEARLEGLYTESEPTPKVGETVTEPLGDVESTAKALESLPKDKDGNIEGIDLSPLDLDNEGIVTWDRKDNKSVAEAYHKAKADNSNPELVNAVEKLLGGEPKVGEGVATDKAAENIATPETLTTQENVPDVLISDIIDKRVTMNGKNGNLYQEENGLVVFNEDGGRKTEIGNINDISDSPISDFKIDTQESVVGADKNGNITVRGESYINPYSNPTAAINYDNKGNVVSVNMETSNGSKRAFRGNIAEDVAYQIHLKEISKDNERLNSFEEYINSEQGQQEINDGEIQGAAETGTKQSDAVVPEKAVTTPSETIKNPAPSVLPNIPASSPTTTTQTTSTPSTKSPKPTTPEEAAKLSKQMIDEEELAVFSFNQKMAKAKSLFSVKKWIDRQATIRKELNRIGAKVTEAFMTNVAGARAFADKRFEDVEKKIYDKLSLDDEKILDQLAFHNRVIQIDENFENRRLDAEIKIEELQKELDAEKARLKSMAKKPTLQEYRKSERLAREIKQQKDNLKDTPLHPKGFDKATSELAIQGLRNEIGDEKFDNLNKRLGDIFSQFNKILEEQYEAGLLNQETYDRFKEDKYIPRRFLTYILIEPGTKNISPIAEKSLTKEQIKSIEGGSESLLFTDTRVLLNAAMRSSASRIAQNYANRALAKTIESLGDDNPIGKKANYSFSKGDIKTDAFGNKVTREPEAGYTNIFYFNEKGERDAIQVKNELAKEWLDVEKQFDDFSPLLKTVLMNGVLKSFATGMNPTFFISNVPVDFVNTILFTNVYDDTNIFNASRKLAAAFTKNAYNYSKLESGANVDPKFKENYTEWVENGGMMQFLTDQGRPDEIAQRDAEIRNKKSLMPLNKLKKGVVNTLAFSGEVSEKAMRLAIFEKTKANLIEEAGGRSKISDTEYKEILAMAAASSRKTMDFAQGGLFAKKADVFLPYLNAAIQGLRVSVEYVKSNPKKFVGKLAQASVPIAALMMYNMSIMDDPEEWADIPPHEKENYFIILKPWKNDEGKREYYRIKKHPSIQWFTNAVESSVIGTRDLSVEQKDKINKGSDFVSSEWETINNALPIPLDWKKSLAKSPAVLQAAIAYVANFDLFRNEKISQDFGEVTPVLEGKYDKNVPLFYKEFGKATGSSPKRTQAAVEKVVTNPGTNAIVGLSYSLLDNMVTGLTGKPKTGTESKYQDASPKGIGDIFKARVVREINPKYSEFKDTRAKDLELELKSQDKEIKSDIKAIIKAKTDNKEAVKDAVDYIKKLDVSVEEKPRLLKFIEDQVKLKQAIGSTPDADLYIDLKYERDPRLKAFVFFDRFGIVDTETKKEVIQNAKKFGYKLFGNDRFDAEYMRLVNEQMALSKSKQK